MRYLILALSMFGISFFVTHFGYAEESSSPFGLSMHGQTKYNADDTHLSYVNPDAPKGGALKTAAIGSFDSLNPYSIKGTAAQNMNLVYDRLMRRVWDEPFTLYPLIAQKLDVAEDRSAVTFHLNPKARFHDGTPITATDVLFSYETLKQHGRPNMRRIYSLISSAEIKNEQTIHFTFGGGYDRETVMIVAMMPVLSKAWWSTREFDSTVTETPVLNGPYRIKNATAGRKIIYERVKDYWAKDLLVNKGHYNFDTITYDYFRDDTIALEAFKKGDLNFRREWDSAKWQSAYKDINNAIALYNAPHQRPERAHGFVFNMRRTLFKDIEIRKALSIAFDAQWVEKNLYNNTLKRIKSVYPNSVLDGSDSVESNVLNGFNDWKDDVNAAVLQNPFITETKMTARDRLKAAKEILENASWIVKDGVRVHKDTGATLSFEIIVSTGQEEKIALSYQKTLQRLGIKMDIRMLDSTSFQERKKSYDYDMISVFWQNSLSPGTEQVAYWSCQAAKEIARFNYAGICNPALDHYAGKIADAKTYSELITYAQSIDRILLSEHIFIPLFYKDVDYIAHTKNIKHPETTPTYGAVVEGWWMDNHE